MEQEVAEEEGKNWGEESQGAEAGEAALGGKVEKESVGDRRAEHR